MERKVKVIMIILSCLLIGGIVTIFVITQTVGIRVRLEETKETKNLNPDVYPAAAKVAATSPRATPKDLKKKDVKISEPKQKTKENIEGTILKIMGTILLFLLIIGVLLPPLLPLMLSLMLIVFICGLIAMKSFAVLTFIGIIAGFIYIAKCQIPDYKLFDDNGNSLYDSRGNRKIS